MVVMTEVLQVAGRFESPYPETNLNLYCIINDFLISTALLLESQLLSFKICTLVEVTGVPLGSVHVYSLRLPSSCLHLSV
jgi:hypothetical protein